MDTTLQSYQEVACNRTLCKFSLLAFLCFLSAMYRRRMLSSMLLPTTALFTEYCVKCGISIVPVHTADLPEKEIQEEQTGRYAGFVFGA